MLMYMMSPDMVSQLTSFPHFHLTRHRRQLVISIHHHMLPLEAIVAISFNVTILLESTEAQRGSTLSRVIQHILCRTGVNPGLLICSDALLDLAVFLKLQLLEHNLQDSFIILALFITSLIVFFKLTQLLKPKYLFQLCSQQKYPQNYWSDKLFFL